MRKSSQNSASTPGTGEPAPESLDDALLRARVKARLFGRAPSVRLGRFELLRRLGQGGEGTVYEARDERDGAIVALKQLHPAHAASGASLKREFRALADLVHPNLVVLHELFHVDEHWFYTMELIAGSDFVGYLRGGVQPACSDRLESALGQLLRGLAALHAAGKMHRDLKPSNVLVRDDGHVVILDYGLVVDEREEVPLAERRAGTPTYAAPEQAAGHVEPASDLYAVGVMLHQALRGELPAAVLERGVPRRAAPVASRPEPPAHLSALCALLLDPEPARRPTAEQALRLCAERTSAIVAHGHAARAQGASCFVGREAILDQLERLAAARPRAPRIALLQGESGIGKTAVLERFCTDRARAGARVLQGRCYERESLPFKALDAIVEQLVPLLEELPEQARESVPAESWSALVRVFPAFARLARAWSPTPLHPALAADTRALRVQAFDAVRALFVALCARHEVVFAIDDLQWGDLDSVALLRHVLGESEAPPLLLVGVLRTEEARTSPVARAILEGDALRGPHLTRLDLGVGPLGSAEARALLKTLWRDRGALSEAQVDACVAQAGGLPFALQQLADHAHHAALPHDGEQQLEEVVRARARGCSASAQALLEVLCVAGRPLEPALALRSAAPEPVTWSAAAELAARKLARWRDTEHERCLEPYHDLVRAAVARGASPARVREIHLAIVDGIAALGRDQPEHLVDHLLSADEPARAGELALVAADRAAAQLAWNRVVDLLRIAERTLTDERLRAESVSERIAESLASAERHREAADAYAIAAGASSLLGERQRLQGLAAQQLIRAGEIEAGSALLKSLLRDAGYRYPESGAGVIAAYVLGRLRLRLASVLPDRPQPSRSAASSQRLQILTSAYNELWTIDPVGAGLVYGWLYRDARRCRDRHLLRALASEVVHLCAKYGHTRRARVGRIVALTEELGDTASSPFEAALPSVARAVYALHSCWSPREALACVTTGEARLAEAPGSSFERSWVAALREDALEMAGDYRALAAAIEERIRRDRTADHAYVRQQRMLSLLNLHLLRDEPERALATLRTEWRRPAKLGLTDYALLARLCLAHLYVGDARTAYATLASEWRALERSGLFRARLVSESASHQRARAAAALYWQTRAPHLKREVRWRCRAGAGCPPAMRAQYALVTASLARAEGRLETCRALLRAAIANSEPHGAAAVAWTGRYRLAQLDGSDGALAEAHAWFEARGVRDPARWITIAAPGSDWA